MDENQAWEEFKQTPEFKEVEAWSVHAGFTENGVRLAFARGFAAGAQTQRLADSVN
jgi:hypothetical protein